MKCAAPALLLSAAIASTILSMPSHARAEEPTAAEDLTQPEARAQVDDGWPENVPVMRWWEYAGGVSLLGGSLAIRFAVDVSGEPTWSGGILLDEATYDTFFIDSPQQFRSWRAAGDIGYLASFAWSLVNPVVAGFTYDWGTSLQMTMMNLEAFSVLSAVLSVSQLIVKRERPSTRECATPPKAGELGVSCGTQNPNVNRSFIGGHAATAATAATLTCMHHANLPLWGSPQADALPCISMAASAAMVFTSRTLTGQHYFTDNMLGVAVGVMSGFVPWWLHYAIPMFEGGVARTASDHRDRDGRPRHEESPAVVPTGAMIAPIESGVSFQVSGLLF